MSESPTEAHASDTYRIGRFTVQFVMRGLEFAARWTPDVPPPGTMSDALLARYVRVRHEFLAAYARKTGRRVCVVDL